MVFERWIGAATETEGRHLRRFLRAQDGTVTIFGLMMFVLMVGVGGIAIDVMRYETQRVQLQYTLDRAVLAAAALDQTLDPEAVVMDYFATSGLEGYRLDVNVEEGIASRRVTATAEMDINSIFMHMFGVRALTSPAFGVAEEGARELEISLVLDISGSMGSNNKIQNLRAAANDFVTEMMDMNSDGDIVSVSIVPYNGRVNAGDTIESVFTLSNEQTESSCTRFDPADFSVTGIDPTVPIERLAHYDHNRRGWYSTFNSPYCQTDQYGAILPWSNDLTALTDSINSLYAEGWTAIDLGMKWAVGLLDPAARPALSQLVAAGTVDADFDGRPYDYEEDDVLKIVVLMTDGANTRQYDVVQEFKRGPSTIYYNEEDDRWSMYMPDLDLYWIPYGRYDDNNGYWAYEPYRGDESQPIDWPWFWARWSARMLAGEFYWYPSSYSGEWDYYRDLRYYSIEQYDGYASADENLRNICDAARDAGIIVFTIGFEAPQGGQEVMEYCATTPAHYYDVQGLEISEAFASIASAINLLRLVQ